MKLRNFKVIIVTFKALLQNKESKLHCSKEISFIQLFLDLIKMKDIEIKINAMICIAHISEHFESHDILDSLKAYDYFFTIFN